MKRKLWKYVMHISPFIKEEEVKSIKEINDWDLLITFNDGKRILFDRFTGCHRNIFYDDLDKITDVQEKREFAYRLRTLMGRKGYTQETLAKELGTSQTMVSRYVSGKVMPSAIVLRKIAKILDYSMDDFFYRNY